jgi:hypothetical protein
MRTLLASLPDDRTLLVGTRRLHANPKEALEACASFLDLTPPPGAIEGFATEFLDPGLHRARPEGAPGPGWPQLAAELFAALRPEATPRPFPGSEARALLSAQQRLDALMPFLRPAARGLNDAGAGAKEAQQELKRAHEELDGLYACFYPLSAVVMEGPVTPAITRALGALEGPLGAAPEQPALLTLAARLHERAGDAAAAEVLWRRLATLLPQVPFPLRGLARVLRRTQRPEEAAQVEAELAQRFPPSAA